MSDTPTLHTADEARRDIELAAALEGVSVEELTERGASIYARKLLAERDAIPLLHPESWRQFRLEDGGMNVSFRVRIPTFLFSHALFIEREMRQIYSDGCSDDACEIAEKHMCAQLNNMPAKNKEERKARTKAYKEQIKAQVELTKRLIDIEKGVEHA